MPRISFFVCRSRAATGLLLAATGIIGGCSFDANELNGYTGIDSGAAVDGASRGIDGPNGTIDVSVDAYPKDSNNRH
jgi:hypothetical protein